MSPVQTEVVALIEHYRFDRMFPGIIYDLERAKSGKMSDGEAEYYVAFLREEAEKLDRFPKHLLDEPSAEELHTDAPPDLEIGGLADQPEVRVGIRLLDRPRSVLLVSAMGGGKTTVVRNIIFGIDRLAKLLGLLISILVMDRKASEQGDLRNRLGSNWHHYSVLQGRWLGLNAPVGVAPAIWIDLISSLFAALAGLIAGAGVLAEAMTWLLWAMNQPPGPVLLWPDFALLLEVLESAPRAFCQKIEHAQSTIHALRNVVRASGELFRTFRGLDVEADLVASGQSACFDIGQSLQPAFLRQFVGFLINAQVLHSRLARGIRGGRAEVVMVNDEGDADLAADLVARQLGDLTPTEHLFKQCRELRVMQVAAMNVLGNASRFVLANPSYTIVGSLNDSKSVEEASRTLMLPRGAHLLLPGLRPGQMLWRQAGIGCSTPILVQIDPLAPNRGAAQPEYEVPAAIPSKPLAELPHVREALRARIQQQNTIRLRTRTKPEPEVSPLAQKLLDAWSLEPCAPLHHLYQRIGCTSGSQQRRIQRELAEPKLAEFFGPRIEKTKVGLMWITDAGWESCNKQPPKLPRRGGPLHTHGAVWVRDAGVREGYKSVTEWIVPNTNHPADVARLVSGQWHVFEICIEAKENVPSHVQACLVDSDAVETVTIVTFQKRELTALREAVEAAFPLSPILSRVRYETIERHYRALYG